MDGIMQPPVEITPEKRAEIQARIDGIPKKWGASLADQKRKEIADNSLWSGNQPLAFSFADWQPAKQPDESLGRKVGNQAFLLAKKMEATPVNVNLFGTRGSGKTSLALAIVDKVAKEEGQSWLFINTTELASLIGQQYEYPELKGKLDRLYKAITGIKSGDGSWYRKPVDILVLDDFGTEGGQRSDDLKVRRDMQEWLYRASNARIDLQNNRPTGSTIITTNNISSELLAMYDSKLISRIVTKQPENVINFTKLKDVRNG